MPGRPGTCHVPVERKLVVHDGERVREVLLVGAVTVGRSSTCEISAADPRLSRVHAVFDVVGADVIVRDLESSNGTRVNGETITKHRLVAGDTVEVGPFKLQLVETANEPADIATPAARDEEATVLRARPVFRDLAAPQAAAEAAREPHAVVPPRVEAPGIQPSPRADEPADATRLMSRPRAVAAALLPTPPEPVAPPRATIRAATPSPSTEGPSAFRRSPAADLSFARATLIWTVPVALVSFLAGLVPDLMQPDQRAPLLRAYYEALAAGAADLVQTSDAADRPIDAVTTALRRHSGVVNARVVGADNRVLAPLSEAGTSVVVPPVSGSTPRVVETAAGLVDVHVPALTPDGRSVIVALVVDPADIHPAPAGSAIGTLLLLLCLGAAWLVARRLTAVTDARLSALGEEVELMTTGQLSTGREPFGLRGAQRILDAVSFALSPAGRRQDGARAPAQRFDQGVAAGGGSTASIETDAAFRIVRADAGCEALLGLVPAAARGMHLIDALPDQAVADEVLRLVGLATPEQAARGHASPGDRSFRLAIDVERSADRVPLTIRFTRL